MTKFLLFSVTAGLLFCLTSCLTLRDADAIPSFHEPDTVPSKTEDTFVPESAEAESLPSESGTAEFPPYVRTVSDGALEWISWYETTYGKGSADVVLLNRTEIGNLNRKMQNEAPNLHDMTVHPQTMRRQEVLDLIHRYELPSDDRYADGHTLITTSMREEIRQNRNLDGIAETVEVRYGIVVERCNLKGFPTDTTFHKSGDLHYDGIQETELITTFPVTILHTSLDRKFVFVQSYFYSGWVPAHAIAFCSEEDYLRFAAAQDFVTVLAKTVSLGNVRLDMGARLPFSAEDAVSYTVLIPKRSDGADGILRLEKAVLSKEDAIRGSLDFTMKNYYRQAFLYLGTEYGWGGADGGVDCSGFVCAVFRTFGIYLPRNTGEQGKYAGNILSLTDNPSGVLDTIRKPAAVYRPGHVMLYLGKKNGKHYIIHAPQGGEQVCVAELSMAKLTSASVFG